VDINNNAELSNTINNLIKESGIKKIVLAEKMGIVNQNLNRKINKKNLSLDETNDIINPLGYKAKIVIEKD
jgi:D-ribose pyranose/furanose isomerase RbsD